MKQVLFLCTGNSARSIMAEAYLNHAGGGQWHGYSAGSKPTGKVNPFAIETLRAQGINTPDSPRSKSWDVFASTNAPILDLVITVCDNAAGETCPVWLTNNGQAPQKIHWSFPDPAAVAGDEKTKRMAFEDVFQNIAEHIDTLIKQSN